VTFVRSGLSGVEDCSTMSCETSSGLTRAMTEVSAGNGLSSLISKISGFPLSISGARRYHLYGSRLLSLNGDYHSKDRAHQQTRNKYHSSRVHVFS
jgi:hypothetical protein